MLYEIVTVLRHTQDVLMKNMARGFTYQGSDNLKLRLLLAQQFVISADILLHLDCWSNQRRENARRYDELLREQQPKFEIVTPLVREAARHIFHQYVLRVPQHRDDLVKHLAENGIGTGIYYPIPLHLQECFAFLGYQEGACPEAERAARETVALPIYPELSESQQGYIVEKFANWSPLALDH